MGTAKRERKKANRQLRLEQLEKQRRQQKAKRRGLQIGIAVPLLVGILVLIVWAVNSGDSKSSSTTTPATDVVDTTDVTDTVAESTVPGSTVAPLDCPKEDGSSVHEGEFPSAPGLCIDTTKVYVATVTTNKGEFTVELDPGIAPNTVNNFVYLANYHYFDGTKCHRIIPGFVVQCGDPTATGSGGPGYSFADELPTAGSYKLGSLAMANSGPDTNGSQFFIITGDDGAALPPNYTLFGQVSTDDMAIVQALNALSNPQDGPPLEPIDIVSITIETA